MPYQFFHDTKCRVSYNNLLELKIENPESFDRTTTYPTRNGHIKEVLATSVRIFASKHERADCRFFVEFLNTFKQTYEYDRTKGEGCEYRYQFIETQNMLMPTQGLASSPDADTLGLSGLGVLSTAGTLNGTTVQNKDTTFTKLFVGGLPYHTTDKSLRDHFSVYGEIEEGVVITDRQTGKSRGYGFVIMADRASAERACKEPNPIIDGRKANVNLAILGAKPRGNVPSSDVLGFPFTTMRPGAYPTLLQSQYGVPQSYTMYQSPYLAATAPGSLVSLPATQLSHAAAVAAATNTFYEYQNAAAVAAAAAAPYTGQYANGFDAYTPYTGAASAANYMPYTYAALPQTPTIPTAATSTAFPGIQYQTATQAPSLQEARLQ